MVTETIRKLQLKLTPNERHILVVLDGIYKGEWLVCMHKLPDMTVFLSLPDKQERIIPNKDIEWGLKNKVLDKAGTLPKKVYDVCRAEYEHAKRNNTSDRREQRASSRTLDRQKYKQALGELQRSGDRNSVYVSEDDKD
jgi:hypothetical protein